MENWLKALVALACLVIIGGGAYFGWGEYQGRAQANIADAYQRERIRCKQVWMDNLSSPSEDNNKKAAFCLFTRAITEAEIKSIISARSN